MSVTLWSSENPTTPTLFWYITQTAMLKIKQLSLYSLWARLQYFILSSISSQDKIVTEIIIEISWKPMNTKEIITKWRLLDPFVAVLCFCHRQIPPTSLLDLWTIHDTLVHLWRSLSTNNRHYCKITRLCY
jgi:hypothetical protein